MILCLQIQTESAARRSCAETTKRMSWHKSMHRAGILQDTTGFDLQSGLIKNDCKLAFWEKKTNTIGNKGSDLKMRICLEQTKNRMKLIKQLDNVRKNAWITHIQEETEIWEMPLLKRTYAY